MKKQSLNKMIISLVLCGIGIVSSPAIARQDELHQQLMQQITKAQQKLKEAEAAKGAARQGLMIEHMNMMHENMGKMRSMKPKAGMTAQEREDWMSEHQKLMDDMMNQMMEEHHMMMNMGKMPMGDMPMGKGEMHKY
jgi:uncharacterized protein YicC (UPF0701 family)